MSADPFGRNPWIDAAAPVHEWHGIPSAEGIEPGLVPFTGPGVPQSGVDVSVSGGLVARRVRPGPVLWIVGAHGGSGESTIAELSPQWAAAGHVWPVHPGARTVLVARTNYSGLTAAQSALTQWAGWRRDTAPRLEGLILVADAPNRLPRPLRDFAALVAGGAPRTFRVPWIEEWRLGEALASSRVITDLVNALNAPVAGANP